MSRANLRSQQTNYLVDIQQLIGFYRATPKSHTCIQLSDSRCHFLRVAFMFRLRSAGALPLGDDFALHSRQTPLLRADDSQIPFNLPPHLVHVSLRRDRAEEQLRFLFLHFRPDLLGVLVDFRAELFHHISHARFDLVELGFVESVDGRFETLVAVSSFLVLFETFAPNLRFLREKFLLLGEQDVVQFAPAFIDALFHRREVVEYSIA